MQAKLYIGNLSYDTQEQELGAAFSKYGEVQSVSIIRDNISGRSRGFGFVEMSSPSDAEKALQSDGTELQGRAITVAEARPPKRNGSSREPRGAFKGARSGFGGNRRAF